MTASYSTGVGFDAIAVALLGRAHPVGILFAGLLFGAMQAGAGNMQILGLPVQMVDVLQAVILLFLTAEIVVRRIFRVRGRGPELVEMETVSRSYAGERAA
jgi:general nucleoside transport system permease protein